MKKFYLYSKSFWSTVLFISVVFTVFILPVLPIEWHKLIFRIFYSLIYISAILSLERRDKKLIVLFFATIFIEWVSALFSLELVYYISRIANVIFFFVLIIKLISQIAKAREVTAGVVLSSVTGYLLLGLIYSIFVAVIMFKDPGAFSNVQPAGASEDGVNISTPLYYSYVTIASLGYGDICPLKPISRSLATIITVSGQFYMAVIVALLVGKFSSRTVNE